MKHTLESTIKITPHARLRKSLQQLWKMVRFGFRQLPKLKPALIILFLNMLTLYAHLMGEGYNPEVIISGSQSPQVPAQITPSV